MIVLALLVFTAAASNGNPSGDLKGIDLKGILTSQNFALSHFVFFEGWFCCVINSLSNPGLHLRLSDRNVYTVQYSASKDRNNECSSK